MKVPLNFGGGSGNGSDDCTATASDVLESKTAIYNGSDDEAEYGTMKDYSGTTSAGTVTNDSSNSRITLTIPNTGKYDTAAKLYNSYSNLASAVGLTAAKIATGNTIMGIAGTYTGLGSATAAQVLSGKTFSTASLSNASGTMTDKSGTSTAATSSTSGSNVRLQIPANGYYNTSAYLTNSYSNMASTIGLTAAKIKYGETILGITGTWQGWVATSTDVYYNGSVGVGGSVTAYSNGTSHTVTIDTNCIVIEHSSGTTIAGAVFGTAISCAGYSKVTMTFQVVSAPAGTYSTSYFGFGLFTSKPTSNSGCDLSDALLSAKRQNDTSTGTFTLSIDLSSVSQSLYVAICSSGYLSYKWTINVTRIQLS